MNLLIIGAGGHAKVVLDAAEQCGSYRSITFLTSDRQAAPILDYPLLCEQDHAPAWLRKHFDQAVVAIGDNAVRRQKALQLTESGIPLATIIHPSAAVSRLATVGPGSVVLAQAAVNPFARVGSACIVNTGAVVEHDCVLEDGVHLSPRAVLGGNVSVGEQSWVCIGSCVIHGVTIGKHTVVGAGATVLHPLPDRVLAVGTPARIIKNYR